MLSPEDAWAAIAAEAETLDIEHVFRADAVGRVLAEDLTATVDVPAHDVSAMDGFALGGDIEAGAALPVDGIVAAGDPPGAELRPGAALQIMTGALAPAGADRVIPIEQTDFEGGDAGAGTVRIVETVPAGSHIRRQAEVTAAGGPLLAEGELLTPGGAGVLATHGIREAPVYRRPTVATLSTGDEVVPAEAEPGPGQLRDSHRDFLRAALAQLGIDARSLGIARDDPAELRAKVERGLDADVLLISGGVSMGEFDFVEQVLGDTGLGCRILFDAVAIQPGKPLVAARHDRGWVFGLPGNPASAMVTYWLLVRPLLRQMTGIADSYWRGALRGRLKGGLPFAKGRDRFLPCRLEFSSGEVLVDPRPPLGSHDLVAYGAGAGLVRVPKFSGPAAAGESCEALPL
ncbi:MAG: molybdopterin molybdotransferase MoeA [Holophagales bacterium]|nr:molybdopterin molybdotransferase MoeA [Holophagales bacterium]MYG30803.1 molybdopterin molybdotransferase MoeA [Holophagales bacterium]MYI81743.1 molybdopterin molybdotransferase MoeA [Holophagales bacterium]